ncbi:MAG: hypothetical protein IT317_04620 [Anaerolineales bacterium]|nr:hypothetical protein [Anaerolineales bacterium]
MPDPIRLNLQAITATDPLAAWLRSYLHPLLFAAVGLALGALYTLILPQINGVLAASLADWPTLLVMLVLVPLILGWYAWQPSAMLALYQGLLARVSEADGAPARMAALLADEHQVRWWTGLVLALTLVFTAALALRVLPAAGPAAGLLVWVVAALRLLIRCLTIYVLLMCLVRQLILILNLNRLFQQAVVQLNPLHPDRAGGLWIMGRFALHSAGLVMLVGLVLSLQSIGARQGGASLGPEFGVEVAVWMVGGVAAFFLPLVEAHRQMAAARTALLSDIVVELNRHGHELMTRLARRETAEASMEHLEALEDFYALAEAAPVWPFDAETLRRFAGVILLPIVLPAAVDAVINVLMR